jgi:hypothetical protein
MGNSYVQISESAYVHIQGMVDIHYLGPLYILNADHSGRAV